jgi:hypothetical protein
MAKAEAVSASTVGRIWREHGIKPHRVPGAPGFKLSNDKRFVEKLDDIVGLYLNPPEHAVVLSCDEKRSPRRPLDRTRDLTGKRLKRGMFTSVEKLIAAIDAYIRTMNQSPKPFIWTAKATDILQKVKLARESLHKSVTG